MGLVDPTPEPTQSDEPQGYVVGRINGDGTYTERDRDEIEHEALRREDEAWRQQAVARVARVAAQAWTRESLRAMGRAMGFEFIDPNTTLFEQLGGTVAG